MYNFVAMETNREPIEYSITVKQIGFHVQAIAKTQNV
jgi:hypothetical protein